MKSPLSYFVTQKIISGGQTGVDLGALWAAQDFGLTVGGWCPPGRVNEQGIIPSIFPLVETPQERSERALHIPRSQRTEWNVRDSDATLILLPKALNAIDSGTKWTKSCTVYFQKPLWVGDPEDQLTLAEIATWLSSAKIRVLHVAGPSEATVPGIESQTYTLIKSLLANMASQT